jgi:hypothetical protein
MAVDRLRPYLSTLMGRSGFQALLARALVLASAEVPWLTAVQAITDGELDGLTVARGAIDADDFSDGEVAVLAQILRLLVAFIGLALTLRLISQLWPELSFKDTDFSDMTRSEEAK